MPMPRSGRAADGVRVECFMVCDFAQVANSKLNIIGGGWDRVSPTSFPFPYRYHLAVKLAVPWAQAQRAIALRIEMSDEEDQPVGLPPMEAVVHMVPTADAIAGQDLGIAVPFLIESTLDRPGFRRIVLFVEGEELARTGFLVVPAPAAEEAADLTPGSEPAPSKRGSRGRG
jgi:hypothetical protein